MRDSFLDLLRSGRRFTLSGHEHPDGDCLGSQVGLYHLLTAIGADVRIVNPDPVARSLRFLERRTPIGNFREQGLRDLDVLVLLDCHEVSRLGRMAEAVRAAAPQVAVIDHHVGADAGDGAICWVDVNAAATGVLVHDLYREFGVALPEAAAEGIFVSLVSDTGWFRYSNTDAKVLSIAKELVACGVRADYVYDRLYRDHDPRFVGLMAESLRRHQYRLNGRLALVAIDLDLNRRIEECDFDTDYVLEPIRSVEGVQVAALVKEIAPGVVKLSLRSMGPVDVQRIARTFGGGGHVKAAGATIRMPTELALDAVEARVREAIAEGGVG